MKKKCIAIALSLTLALPFMGCGDKKDETGDLATVWTAAGTERVLGDVDYSARYERNALTINAFKNEYESAQIIISAKQNIDAYSIKTADLKDGDGNVLSKDAFELFHEKYMYVGQIKNHNSPTGVGYYPDALLPMDVAQAYGETNVKENFNQAVWVALNVPQDQAAGTYKGNFTVDLDGEAVSVPVTVEVYDYLLDGEVHSKSAFYLHPQRLAWGEMDDSQEMQEKYYEYLLSYRITPTHLPGIELTYVSLDDEAMARFLAYAEKYTLDERCTHFNIPYDQTVTTVDGQTMMCVDWEEFGDTLRKMAVYSAEKGVNLFEKAGTYFTFFDEHDLNGTTHIANYNLNYAYKFCEQVAADLETELDCDAELKSEILHDLANLKHKIVGSYTEDVVADKAQFVPTIDRFNSEEGRTMYEQLDKKSYGDDGEMWTYTCMSPRPPYPTYHLDDTLLSSRLLNWMMYDYDIVGNLYWDTVFYTYYEQSDLNTELQLQDYYDTALRFPTANGDGYLLYPGRPYGIDGPVGSVRLQSIRDGVEDYDLFYALEQIYENRGASEDAFNAISDLLTRNLYSGTAVRMSDEMYDTFADSRESLAGLLTSAANAGTVIEQMRVEKGKMKFVVSAPSDTSLTLDGKKLTGTANGELVSYAFEIELKNAVNMLSLKSERAGKTYEISLNLGGMSKSVSASTLSSKVNMITGGTASVDTVEETQVLKLDYTAAERMVADIDATSLGITAEAVKVRFAVYLYGDKNVSMTIRAKCENGSVYDEVTTVELKPGWNEINVSTLSFGCQTYGMLKYLRLNPLGNEAVALALGEIAIEG